MFRWKKTFAAVRSPFLRSESGVLLEVKEGVVVDDKGQPVGGFWQARKSTFDRLRSILSRGGIPLSIVSAFAIPVALFAGLAVLTLIGGIAAVFIILMLFESLFGIGVRPTTNSHRRG